MEAKPKGENNCLNLNQAFICLNKLLQIWGQI